MLKKIILSFIILFILLGLNYLFTDWINPYITQIVILIGINIIMTVSLNLINGFTGQFSLGHAGFMAVGAYASSALSVYEGAFFGGNPFLEQFGFILFLICGGLISALFGFVIGLPSLKLKGDYLAIVTLGFGEIIRVTILNLDFIGGARGLTDIPDRVNFFWAYLSVVIVVYLLWHLVYSVKGKAFMAVRDDEIAAESIGIPSTRIKVTAFVIGAFFAGIGGGLFAHFITYLNPSSFTFLRSVEYVVMVVLGGMGSITGSILAAIFLTALPELLREVSDYRMVAYSILLIVIMIWRPRGIMGDREWNRFFK